MRLTFSTDYSLRLLMLAGLEADRLVTIEEVADRFGISKNHLMKVAHQLGQAGYLETVRGRNGGLRLGKAPDQIVVGEVVRKMEPDFAVVECQNPAGYCTIASCCTLRSAMREAVQAFLAKLDEYTLEDLLRHKFKLRHLLGVN
jgi:Rrf2 family transcriptional regulator, nitric oxide-sensitive transcriptional repressor